MKTTTKVKKSANSSVKEIRFVEVRGKLQLELRSRLGVPRNIFGRLVNNSERTIAESESKSSRPKNLQRPYREVQDLCDALGEVVDPKSLGEWLTTPNEAFDGSKPLEVIERGEIKRLWEMFFRLRSGIPS